MRLYEIKNIYSEVETLTEQELDLLIEGFFTDTARRFLGKLGGKIKRAAVAAILAIATMSVSIPAMASVESMVYDAAAKGYTPAQIQMVIKDTKFQIANDCLSLAVYNNIVKKAIEQDPNVQNKDEVLKQIDAKNVKLLNVVGNVYGEEAKARITVEFQRQMKEINNDLSKLSVLAAEMKPIAAEVNDLSGATLEHLVSKNLEKIQPAPEENQ